MDWGPLVVILFAWNLIGGVTLSACQNSQQNNPGALGQSRGWEFVNPLHVYKHNHVNWFGAIMVALWYSLLCPIATLVYWFYKLCTVGRK